MDTAGTVGAPSAPAPTDDDARLASPRGALYFAVGRPDRGVAQHVHDDLEATGAERREAVGQS